MDRSFNIKMRRTPAGGLSGHAPCDVRWRLLYTRAEYRALVGEIRKKGDIALGTEVDVLVEGNAKKSSRQC